MLSSSHTVISYGDVASIRGSSRTLLDGVRNVGTAFVVGSNVRAQESAVYKVNLLVGRNTLNNSTACITYFPASLYVAVQVGDGLSHVVGCSSGVVCTTRTRTRGVHCVAETLNCTCSGVHSSGAAQHVGCAVSQTIQLAAIHRVFARGRHSTVSHVGDLIATHIQVAICCGFQSGRGRRVSTVTKSDAAHFVQVFGQFYSDSIAICNLNANVVIGQSTLGTTQDINGLTRSALDETRSGGRHTILVSQTYGVICSKAQRLRQLVQLATVDSVGTLCTDQTSSYTLNTACSGGITHSNHADGLCTSEVVGGPIQCVRRVVAHTRRDCTSWNEGRRVA